jgi:hypothetical protein
MYLTHEIIRERDYKKKIINFGTLSFLHGAYEILERMITLSFLHRAAPLGPPTLVVPSLCRCYTGI